LNKWIRKSIEIAYGAAYLDRVHSIYNVSKIENRNIDVELIHKIIDAHKSKNSSLLIEHLLDLPKFPVDDIYVGFLRINKDSIFENPYTVNRISKWLLAMPIEDLLKLCKQSKSNSRRMGELFHKWFINLNYPKLDYGLFSKLDEVKNLDGSKSSILMLNGNRKTFREFANNELNCGLEKELDFIMKVYGEYIIGEAKYFSAFGGTQTARFEDTLTFLQNTQGDATRIAIFDGVIWLDTGNRMSKKIRRLSYIVLTGLLLDNFLHDFKNLIYLGNK